LSGSFLTFTPAPGFRGTVTVTYTVSDGYATSAGTATFTVTQTFSRLVNISSRGQVGAGDKVLIGGFVLGPTGPKTVLIRAAGPALNGLGVSGTLSQPVVTLYQGSTVLATNRGWSNAPNSLAIATLPPPAWARSLFPPAAMTQRF